MSELEQLELNDPRPACLLSFGKWKPFLSSHDSEDFDMTSPCRMR